MRPYILLLLILISCEKYADYSKDDMGHIFLTPIGAQIESVEPLHWKEFNNLISEGVRITIRLPRFRQEDLQDLLAGTRVNAWLIRIFREQGLKRELLNQIYAPIDHEHHYQLIDLLYSAAVAHRGTSSPCPKFNHQLKIGILSIQHSGEKIEQLMAGSIDKGDIQGNVSGLGKDGIGINSGRDLQGTYTFELALYNSDKRIRYSNFVELPENLNIEQDRKRFLKGCSNFELP